MPLQSQINLPPLPELFGNPVLREELIEISQAADIDWWPQTPGWYAMAAILAYVGGRAAWRRCRRWLRDRYRREAIRRLEQLGSRATPAAVNEILKLAAIAASHRAAVASLSGAAWRDWLTQQCDQAVLGEASLIQLTEAQYLPSTTGKHSDIETLVTEAHEWLMQHRDDHAVP